MSTLTTIGTGGQAFGNGAAAFGTAATYVAYPGGPPPVRADQALPFPFSLAMSAPNTTNLLAQQAFTFECWVRVKAYANPPDNPYISGFFGSDVAQVLLLGSYGTGMYSLRLDVCYETLRLINYQNGQQLRDVGQNIPAGVWTHLACSFNLDAATSSTVRMYRNGMPTLQGVMNIGFYPMLGYSVGNIDTYRNAEALYADLDEVRLWSVERTPQQILASYLATNAALLAAGELTASNCLAAYSFEQPYAPGNEPTFLDTSGNGLHLQSSLHAWEQQPILSTVPFTA